MQLFFETPIISLEFCMLQIRPPLSEHSWDRVKTFPKSHGSDVIPPRGSAVQIFLLTGTGMVVNCLKVIGSNPSGHSRMKAARRAEPCRVTRGDLDLRVLECLRPPGSLPGHIHSLLGESGPA